MLILRETDRRISEDTAPPDLKLRYDGEQAGFIVNRLDLIYNIEYSSGLEECKPVWVIK
jgi:hypothetical protein